MTYIIQNEIKNTADITLAVFFQKNINMSEK